MFDNLAQNARKITSERYAVPYDDPREVQLGPETQTATTSTDHEQQETWPTADPRGVIVTTQEAVPTMQTPDTGKVP